MKPKNAEIIVKRVYSSKHHGLSDRLLELVAFFYLRWGIQFLRCKTRVMSLQKSSYHPVAKRGGPDFGQSQETLDSSRQY